PVKTIYGYHIIKLAEKRKISFDDSKEKIMQMVQNNRQKEIFGKLISGLKEKYTVQVNEKLLK
ncbi:MAG TPA: peptidylprolyl isomerase, partial [Candidatus Goldiibacteriota bacterium]|nr:peptidylprolyl isomerase [Candidatus Goldiibacteriota bacterium]